MSAALYARVPRVHGCKPGCADCCGPVPMSRGEAAAIPSVIRPEPFGNAAITPTKSGCMTCVYSTPAGCSVYSARPLMCRLFGAVDDPKLTCPHGARAKRPLSAAAARALVEQYQKEMAA